MNCPRRRISLLFALLLLGTFLLGGLEGNVRASSSGRAGPTLAIDAPQPQTLGTMWVTGVGFTPGGPVSVIEYVAITDQSGLLLFTSRSIAASLTQGATGPGDSATPGPLVQGGDVHERFDNLCGSTALLRAYDGTTAVWSNWLTLQPNC